MTPTAPSLLVVDDNEANRDLLSRRLERKGYDVTTADDGEAALELIESRSFELVLLDHMMPGLSGLEVLRRVRENHSIADLPVIMVTAEHGSDTTVNAIECGANDYVTKPIDFPVLMARLEAQLTRKSAEQELRELNASLERRVRERTENLLATNEALRDEIAHRERAEREKDRLESYFRHQQKLEALGTLAGGIAHEFNNALLPIIMLAELVMDEAPAKSTAHDNLGNILKAAHGAKDLVNQILAFSKQEASRIEPVEIHAVVAEALQLLRASLPSTIEISQDIDEGTGRVEADTGQLYQLLLNLGSNAAQAMPDRKGRIEFSVRKVEIDADRPSGATGPGPGYYAEITVKDSGCGMDDTTMERIFDPFFTTREVGEGTGLGLSVAHGIVAEHGGAITVTSAVGKGSRFTILLPLIRASRQPRAVAC